jgi:glycosyltransferase 2 family protein
VRMPVIVSRYGRVALTGAVLAVIWQVAGGPAALDRLGEADLRWIAAAFVALNLQTVASAFRWRLTAAQLGQSIAPGRAVREYYLAQLLNNTLPGGVAGDAGRALRARHEAGLVRAGQAVMIERLAGQIALCTVGLAAALAMAALNPGDGSWRRWPFPFAVALATCAALAFPAFHILRRRVPGMAAASAAFADAVRRGLLPRGVWPVQVALSLATVACNLAAFASCAHAIGTTLPLVAVLTVVPLVLLAMLVPVTVGGWGTREAVAAALWPLLGSSAAAGIAASATFGLTTLAASLPGLVVLLWPAGGAPAADLSNLGARSTLNGPRGEIG